MKRIALFPGSFDPFTKGHEDIVRRGSRFFDEIVIGIGHNSQKQRFFSLELMLACINTTFTNTPNVRVEVFQGLTASFAEKVGANFLLRGLRNTTDFEYENTIAQVNSNLVEGLETVLLITTPRHAYISSTIVRDIYRYGGNVDKYLPYNLAAHLAAQPQV
ncbi:MAG: pantetheine-phosphate adenylyltransferase [Bernardetiaceae bacterium]|jgi:pantetheine-phosphate adenylyltransferase|nr:pantetheine-phosphate adenylyltransferase [Bernardetiaceae bacterium]